MLKQFLYQVSYPVFSCHTCGKIFGRLEAVKCIVKPGGEIEYHCAKHHTLWYRTETARDREVVRIIESIKVTNVVDSPQSLLEWWSHSQDLYRIGDYDLRFLGALIITGANEINASYNERTGEFDHGLVLTWIARILKAVPEEYRDSTTN